MSKYSTLIYKLPKLSNNILDSNTDLELSNSIEYPKFTLGFHHYIHQNKDKINIFNEYKDKKKVYLVINKFEKLIDDYEKSIDLEALKYFGIKSDIGILGRSFYKFWEILMSFNLINKDKPITTAHIADRGTSVQAISCYRNMFSRSNKDDKYYSIPITNQEIAGNILPIDSKIVDYYKKEKSSNFVQNRAKREQSRSGNGGELFDEKIIKDKIDLIFAYSGYNWTNKNVQEQQAHRLLLGEIIIALKIQAKGGNFVCKIYESFTKTTLKLISVLLSVYENVHVIKPYMSRSYNSEKFLVCMNYSGNSKGVDKLETLLDTLINEKNKHIVNIFPGFKLDDDIKNSFIKINTEISNNQLININEIMDFLNKQNYRGDVYHDKRNQQISASEYWISRFFVDKQNIDDNKNKIINDNNDIIQKNDALIKQLTKSIN